MPLVALDQASLAFGHVPLLDHVNLSLDSGERVALIGRNGTGKSSLLRVLAGEQSLDSGTLWRKPELRVARATRAACGGSSSCAANGRRDASA